MSLPGCPGQGPQCQGPKALAPQGAGEERTGGTQGLTQLLWVSGSRTWGIGARALVEQEAEEERVWGDQLWGARDRVRGQGWHKS